MAKPFIAPELVRGQTRCTVRTDLYSLGVNLYFIAEQRSPFLNESLQYTGGILSLILKGSITPFIILKNEQQKKLIMELMSMDPDKRPTTDQILNIPEVQYALYDDTTPIHPLLALNPTGYPSSQFQLQPFPYLSQQQSSSSLHTPQSQQQIIVQQSSSQSTSLQLIKLINSRSPHPLLNQFIPPALNYSQLLQPSNTSTIQSSQSGSNQQQSQQQQYNQSSSNYISQFISQQQIPSQSQLIKLELANCIRAGFVDMISDVENEEIEEKLEECSKGAVLDEIYQQLSVVLERLVNDKQFEDKKVEIVNEQQITNIFQANKNKSTFFTEENKDSEEIMQLISRQQSFLMNNGKIQQKSIEIWKELGEGIEYADAWAYIDGSCDILTAYITDRNNEQQHQQQQQLQQRLQLILKTQELQQMQMCYCSKQNQMIISSLIDSKIIELLKQFIYIGCLNRIGASLIDFFLQLSIYNQLQYIPQYASLLKQQLNQSSQQRNINIRDKLLQNDQEQQSQSNSYSFLQSLTYLINHNSEYISIGALLSIKNIIFSQQFRINENEVEKENDEQNKENLKDNQNIIEKDIGNIDVNQIQGEKEQDIVTNNEIKDNNKQDDNINTIESFVVNLQTSPFQFSEQHQTQSQFISQQPYYQILQANPLTYQSSFLSYSSYIVLFSIIQNDIIEQMIQFGINNKNSSQNIHSYTASLVLIILHHLQNYLNDYIDYINNRINYKNKQQQYQQQEQYISHLRYIHHILSNICHFKYHLNIPNVLINTQSEETNINKNKEKVKEREKQKEKQKNDNKQQENESNQEKDNKPDLELQNYFLGALQLQLETQINIQFNLVHRDYKSNLREQLIANLKKGITSKNEIVVKQMIDALSIIVMDAANHKFIITDSFLSKLFDLLRSDVYQRNGTIINFFIQLMSMSSSSKYQSQQYFQAQQQQLLLQQTQQVQKAVKDAVQKKFLRKLIQSANQNINNNNNNTINNDQSQTKCNIPHEARLLLSWVTDNELMKRIEIIRDIVINDEEKEDENKNGSKESIKQQIDVQQEQEQNDTTEYQQQTNPHIQSVISQLPEFASIIKKIVSRDDLEGGRLIICEIANWITNEPEILELLLRRENIGLDVNLNEMEKDQQNNIQQQQQQQQQQSNKPVQSDNDVIQALLQLLDSQPTDTVSIEYVIPIYKITNYCDEEYRSQLVQKGFIKSLSKFLGNKLQTLLILVVNSICWILSSCVNEQTDGYSEHPLLEELSKDGTVDKLISIAAEYSTYNQQQEQQDPIQQQQQQQSSSSSSPSSVQSSSIQSEAQSSSLLSNQSSSLQSQQSQIQQTSIQQDTTLDPNILSWVSISLAHLFRYRILPNKCASSVINCLIQLTKPDMDKYFVLTGVAALNDLAACVDNHQILLDHNLVSIFAEFIHDEGDLWTGCTNSLYLLINIYQLGTKQTKQKLKEDMPIELVHELAQSENQQIANNAKFLAQLYQES